MKQVISAALLSAAILFTAPAAVAEEYGVGPYFGAGVAHVTVQDYCVGVTGSCEDAELGFKIFGGFRPVENFGVEAGYARAEGFKVNGQVSGTSITAESEYSTFYLAGTGVLPLGDVFALTGKAGFHIWDVDITGPGGVVGLNSTDPLFGVGAEFRPTDNIVLQVEWIRFLGEDDGIDGDTDAISGNFALAF